MLFQSKTVGESLSATLSTEFSIKVPYPILLAIDCTNRNSKLIWIDFGKLRNIISTFTLFVVFNLFVDLLNNLDELLEVRDLEFAS